MMRPLKNEKTAALMVAQLRMIVDTCNSIPFWEKKEVAYMVM